MALPWLFEHWAIEGHQLAPDGDWSTWVILGGRGAGKTRAGSEWVRSMVEGGRPGDPGRRSRVALVGETLDQVREVMIFGESGILACSPPDRRPEWQATRKRLVWPNGAVAQTFSASDPESLRGPQFDCAWCDELAKWRKGQEAWDMLRFALRLGELPQALVTTSPRSVPLLQAILDEAGTVVTRAPTSANRMHLARSFLETVTRAYAGSKLGRQELDGEIVRDLDGALWPWELIEAAHRPGPETLDRVVVAVDPPATAGGDECGIVVVGAVTDGPPTGWRAEVLADASIAAASPNGWAERAVEAFHRHRADRLVAEVNQGGDMVATLIRQVDPLVPFRAVRASQGKAARAEPVAALYEQGRVTHRGVFAALEAQMAQMTTGGFAGKGSPDRVDALVWAITELIVDPASRHLRPQIRGL
ncbi:terminase family protein [Amaricoccus sp.]|uniref:DNA-packaging protein n=1 Tax=Amaricoccus sp. TaxID=1872485 RepID=UPI001B3F1CDF|nr:terminase family protein [Amaricoccus sp.]MBP7002245.1 DNA-packaging protein [Amaricoccus sp.]